MGGFWGGGTVGTHTIQMKFLAALARAGKALTAGRAPFGRVFG